ncbi:MAG: hypothetical protein L7U87_04835 [Chlamydiales bacterium]|nr:hypothetical protein [Chlamydiales bacterium]
MADSIDSPPKRRRLAIDTSFSEAETSPSPSVKVSSGLAQEVTQMLSCYSLVRGVEDFHKRIITCLSLLDKPRWKDSKEKIDTLVQLVFSFYATLNSTKEEERGEKLETIKAETLTETFPSYISDTVLVESFMKLISSTSIVRETSFSAAPSSYQLSERVIRLVGALLSP